jgi:hypothetical protein
LFCPNCHAEFRPGFTRCSDCDVALVESLDGVTLEMEEEGSSTGLEPFHETHSSDELAAILESLEEGGVPYVVQAGTALSLLTPSATGADELPEEWQARILVPGASLKAARELLRQLREAARSAAAASLRGLT